jgi:hypothetical protein
MQVVVHIRVRIDQNATWPPLMPFGTAKGEVRYSLSQLKQCSNVYFLDHVDKMELRDWFNALRESGMVFCSFSIDANPYLTREI